MKTALVKQKNVVLPMLKADERTQFLLDLLFTWGTKSLRLKPTQMRQN